MHFICHETNKLLSPDFGGFSLQYKKAEKAIEQNSRTWTKIVHLVLPPPSQVAVGGIEFEQRLDGHGRRVYHSIH